MEPTLIICIILGIGVLVLSFFTLQLNNRITRLGSGKNAVSLESTIVDNQKRIAQLESHLDVQDTHIDVLNKKIQESIRHVGVVRFNPYKETGGSQSFAIALTNEKKNGVVISSMYAREHMRVFAKPIIQGSSDYILTKEEEQALTQSLETL